MAYTTIDDPEAYFQVQLYTGDGSDDHAIALDGDTDMQPDLVYIKNRDTGDNPTIFDSIRGVTKYIGQVTAAEVTDDDTLDAFQSDGFKTDDDDLTNTNAEKYLAMCWKAGTTASGTTTGSGTGKAYSSTYNDTSKFQITGYLGNGTSGHTIPVGLSTAPKALWCKSRGTGEWILYHHKLTVAPETEYQKHSTPVAVDDVAAWNDTEPSSSIVTLGNLASHNGDDVTNIMYAFDEVQGFSKFGHWVGNGSSSDGPFVYCGFRPALVINRKYNNTAGTTNFWTDEQNQSQNVMDTLQYVGWNDVEYGNPAAPQVTYQIDFLSNGFKFRGVRADTNVSGNGHIFWAFAKSPFVNSNGVPGTAL